MGHLNTRISSSFSSRQPHMITDVEQQTNSPPDWTVLAVGTESASDLMGQIVGRDSVPDWTGPDVVRLCLNSECARLEVRNSRSLTLSHYAKAVPIH